MIHFLAVFCLLLVQVNFCVDPCKSSIEQGRIEEEEIPILSSSSLRALPNDLLVVILDQLDGENLLTIRRVCKELKVLIDQHSSKLPKDDEELLRIIDTSPERIIPAKFKLLLLNIKHKEETLTVAERMSVMAYQYYRDHNRYYTPEDRENSTRNWERYRMLLFVAYKLGKNQVLSTIQKDLAHKKYEIQDFSIHLSRCSPSSLNIEQIIHSFWWEQIAALDINERSGLGDAYEKGETLLKDPKRAVYWKSYKNEYDFPSLLLEQLVINLD